jgi:hypothetical protein
LEHESVRPALSNAAIAFDVADSSISAACWTKSHFGSGCKDRPAGRDQAFAGQKLGAEHLADAVLLALRAEPADFALAVEAKGNKVAAYYRHHGAWSASTRR